MTDTIAELRALLAACTKGDLSTAQRHIVCESVECPACQGDGEVEAADYCNFDGVALGVQFYGIGREFGAHEKLWTAVVAALPALLDRVEAGEVAIAALEDRAGNADRRYRHTRQWNAERWECITAYSKEHGFWDDIACIMANGTLNMSEGRAYDPPTYAQQLNIAIHRADAAEDRASKMQGRLEEAESIIQRLHDYDSWGGKGFHGGHALDAKNDGIRFLQQKADTP